MGKQSREKKERRDNSLTNILRSAGQLTGLEKFYFYFILAGSCLTLFSPLYMSGKYFFPYVVPKTILFRICVDIVFIVWALLALSNSKFRPKKNALTITLAIFLLVLTVTSFTGIDFSRSFWSTFERMGGLLTFYHLFAFYLVLTSTFKERKYWEIILSAAIAATLFVTLFALISKDPTARGGGTIGNTSFLSSYLIFSLFFSLILFLTKNWVGKIIYGVPMAFIASLLFLPYQEPSRGAIGGFLIGVAILVFTFLLFYTWLQKRQYFKWLIVAFFVLGLIAFFSINQFNIFRQYLDSLEQSTSWQARAIVWDMGWQAWKEKFWLGWGLDNFNIAFTKYYVPALPLSGDIWYDRVHNILLDMPVNAGIFGLLSYLSIFGVAIFGLLKIAPKALQKKNMLLPLGMVSLLVAYLIQDVFVFDMISSYMMFFLSLAFIAFLTQKRSEVQEPEKLNNAKTPLHYSLAITMIILAVTAFYWGNIQVARASQYVVKGISYPLKDGFPYLEKALTFSPIALSEGSEQMGRAIAEQMYDTTIDQKLLAADFDSAIKTMEKAIKDSPQDFRAHLMLGRTYMDYANVFKDGSKIPLAENILKKAIELSPKNQQAYWSLSEVKIMQSQPEEAVALMKKSVEVEPRYYQSHWYLAMIYSMNGEYRLALDEIKVSEGPAEKAGFFWRKSMDYLDSMINAYVALSDMSENDEYQANENLIQLYTNALELSPKTAKYWAGLAVAYANLGYYDKARNVAQKGIELNPNYKDTLEEFINSLPSK